MPLAAFFKWASGNTITSARLNRIEQFAPNVVWACVVGGGGGGGDAPNAPLNEHIRTAGGGGGEVVIVPILITKNDAWSVSVGGGGARSANGISSTITRGAYVITAAGGGAGGDGEGGLTGQAGSNGGCGGGATGRGYAPGVGSGGGHGGSGMDSVYAAANEITVGGGGGGAGGNGSGAWLLEDASANVANTANWSIANGGPGLRFFVNGVFYGGGGANGTANAKGGVGGGANGPAAVPGGGTNGTADRGGGGSGCAADPPTFRYGGQGGGGIVIFAYPGEVTGSWPTGDVRASGGTIAALNNGWITHTFTGAGTFTWLTD